MSGARSWPADAVMRMPLASLVPSARNARTHSADQIKQIMRSITEFGFTMPVLVDEAGGIIAGHGRVLAADGLGLDEVPVVVAVGWSDERKRAYMLADNKIALNSGWDEVMLTAELRDLAGLGVDLGLLGFGAFDLQELGLTPANDPDQASNVGGGTLARSFGVAPFSVISARDGWWQERKAAWLALGIRSEEGREVDLLALAGSTVRQKQYDAKRRNRAADAGKK